MSINNSHYGTNGVLLYSGERILIYYDGVEFSVDPDLPNSIFKGHKKGRIYLTSHRVVFINKNQNDTFKSFSMPFYCLRNLDIEQPVFGANYIKGQVRAEPQGQWNGIAKFKLWFNNGGAIDFGQALLQAGRLASQMSPNFNNYAEQPPSYSTCETVYAAPPPAYQPAPDYGWIPVERFPDRPAENTVYVQDQPPPYSGIFAQSQAAGQIPNGFYNPQDPSKVYVPSSAPSYDDNPPPYNNNKKND